MLIINDNFKNESGVRLEAKLCNSIYFNFLLNVIAFLSGVQRIF